MEVLFAVVVAKVWHHAFVHRLLLGREKSPTFIQVFKDRTNLVVSIIVVHITVICEM